MKKSWRDVDSSSCLKKKGWGITPSSFSPWLLMAGDKVEMTLVWLRYLWRVWRSFPRGKAAYYWPCSMTTKDLHLQSTCGNLHHLCKNTSLNIPPFFHFYEQFTPRTNDFLASISTIMKLPNDLWSYKGLQKRYTLLPGRLQIYTGVFMRQRTKEHDSLEITSFSVSHQLSAPQSCWSADLQSIHIILTGSSLSVLLK